MPKLSERFLKEPPCFKRQIGENEEWTYFDYVNVTYLIFNDYYNIILKGLSCEVLDVPQ